MCCVLLVYRLHILGFDLRGNLDLNLLALGWRVFYLIHMGSVLYVAYVCERKLPSVLLQRICVCCRLRSGLSWGGVSSCGLVVSVTHCSCNIFSMLCWLE